MPARTSAKQTGSNAWREQTASRVPCHRSRSDVTLSPACTPARSSSEVPRSARQPPRNSRPVQSSAPLTSRERMPRSKSTGVANARPLTSRQQISRSDPSGGRRSTGSRSARSAGSTGRNLQAGDVKIHGGQPMRHKEIPDDMPPAGYVRQDRLIRPDVMPYTYGSYQFSPQPRSGRRKSESSVASGDTGVSMSSSQFAAIKDKLGCRMAARFKTTTRAFRLYDDDKSGELCKDENRALFESYGFNTKIADSFFHHMDTDGGGALQMDEFKTMVSPYVQPKYETDVTNCYKGMQSTSQFYYSPLHAKKPA